MVPQIVLTWEYFREPQESSRIGLPLHGAEVHRVNMGFESTALGLDLMRMLACLVLLVNTWPF